MKYDEIFLKVINALVNYENLTSTDLTKIVFEGIEKDRELLQSKNNLIISRLKTWIKKGFIVNGTMENRVAHYSLNDDIIEVGDFTFENENGREIAGVAIRIDIEGEPISYKILDADFC